MKKVILSSLSILILGIILTNISCEQLDIKSVTKINTGEVSDIGYYKATIQGTVIDVGENVREIGHCWDTISSPKTDKNKQAISDDLNQGTGIYTEMTSLRPGHKYYVRAYAITDNKTTYGEETTFETTKLPDFALNLSFPATNSLWPVGKSRKIAWTTDIPGAFKLTLFKYEGGTDVDLREIATTDVGAREYDYVLPSDAVTAGDYYAIKIESIDIPEIYNLQGFKATDPTISLVQPDANTKWNINREYTIEWNSTDIDRVDIGLLQDGNWVLDITYAHLNNESQPWDIPQSLTPGTNYQVKISYADFPEIMVISDNFEILGEANISVTAPVAADDWQAGSTHEITWTDNISENVRIELFKNGTWETEIVSSTESNGTYSWTLPSGMTAGTDYTIKVTMVGDDNVVGESTQFAVSVTAPYINISLPTTGDHLLNEETYTITWTDNISENVNIDLYKGGLFISNIIANTSSEGSYNWIPSSLTAGTDYSIKISSVNNNSITDESDQFSIAALFDYDENGYNSITIGTQIWMKENLKVTHYTSGNTIPNVTGNAAWAALNDDNIDKAYCWYNDDEATYKETYGALYTWAGAMDGASSSTANPSNIQGVCPTGWHLPSDAEWTELTDYLTNNGYGYEGSGDDIGKSMATTSGWATDGTAGNIGNDQATNNSSGFSALPAGMRRDDDGSSRFGGGGVGYWWSSTEYNSSSVNYRALSYSSSDVVHSNYVKSGGYSVRCVKN